MLKGLFVSGCHNLCLEQVVLLWLWAFLMFIMICCVLLFSHVMPIILTVFGAENSIFYLSNVFSYDPMALSKLYSFYFFSTGRFADIIKYL